MPPWAQTLCERFTGTIENRSTGTPSSASLMVQARPARPPPTTMTRFLDAAMTLVRSLCVHFGPLGRDELQMVIQVLVVLLHLIAERDFSGFVVDAGALKRLGRQLPQHARELPAIK